MARMAFAAASIPLVVLAFVGAPGCGDTCEVVPATECPRGIEASPSTTSAGGSVRITGDGFTNRCEAMGECKPVRSLRDLQVTVDQDGVSYPLRVLDADDGEIDVTLVLPEELRPGQATMAVGGTNAVITILP